LAEILKKVGHKYTNSNTKKQTMKNYNYRLLGSSIMGETECETVSDLAETILNQWGAGTKIEYWSECGQFSGTIACINKGFRYYNDYK
jgi:hypothetical protein